MSKKGITRIRHPLNTVAGCIAEATKVYRLARKGKMETDTARSLVWMLSTIRSMLEAQILERLEARLEEISASTEHRSNGHAITDRAHQLTH